MIRTDIKYFILPFYSLPHPDSIYSWTILYMDVYLYLCFVFTTIV